MKIKFLKVAIISVVLTLALYCSAYAEIEVSQDGNSISGYGIVTDNFEHIELTEETRIPNYPSTNYTSDVLRYQGADYNFDNRDMFLAPGKGTDNSNALKIGIITGGARNLRALTKSIAYRDAGGQIIEGMNAVYTYDILIEEDPASTYNNTGCFYIGFSKGLFGFNTTECVIFDMQIDDEGRFYFRAQGESNGTKLYYEKNKWYTVELVHSESYISGSIMDRETGEVLLTNTKAKESTVVYENFNTMYLNPHYATHPDHTGKIDHNKGFVAYVDNLQINVFDKNAPVELTSSTLGESTIDIPRSGAVILTFSQAVEAEDIAVCDKDGNPLPKNSYEIKSFGMFKRQLVFTKLLEKKSQYTIDLSELGISDITFTTKAQYVLDVDVTETVLSNENKTATVSYKLNDTSLSKIDCRLMGILYKEGKMVDATVVPLTDAAFNTTVTTPLTFTQAIDGDTTLSIVFFENGNYIPLSTGVTCD